MSTRRRHRKAGTNKFKPSQQASLNPEEPFDWPGVIEQKYIDDIRGRLNSLENSFVTDEFIKAFLAAHNNDSRHAVEGIKNTLEFRKGRQMFYNHYRTTLPRYMFLQSCRSQGIGPASTFGHSKDKRIIFYEKMENWNLPFDKEFSETEFIDHVITWSQLLYSMALANNGQSPLIIHPPSKNSNGNNLNSDNNDSKTKETNDNKNVNNNSNNSSDINNKNNINNNNNNNNNNNGSSSNNSIITINSNDSESETKGEFNSMDNNDDSSVAPPSVEVENDFVFQSQPRIIDPNCKYPDVIGIIDWQNCDETKLMANENLLLAAESIISKHFPFLIYRLIHINMPMTFDSIFKKLKPKLDPQSILKSVFYETDEMKEKRAKYGKEKSKRNNRRAVSNGFRKNENGNGNGNGNDGDSDNSNESGSGNEKINFDSNVTEMLLKIIDKEYLPKEYGGDAQNAFKKCDSMFANLIGYSAIAEDSSFDDYDNNDDNYNKNNENDGKEKDSWQSVALNRGERHTIRETVERGQHWTWEYNVVETGSSIFFGVTYECGGYRGKTIKIIAREETEHKCSFYPIYGDFVILKEGKLEFQFRNVPRGKRINLKFKIACETLPQEHVNKFLPSYQAEEKLLMLESSEHLSTRRRQNNGQRGNAKARLAKTPQPMHRKGTQSKNQASKSSRALLSDDDEPQTNDNEED